MNKATLAAFIASHVCHDAIASSVGINYGLEMMTDDSLGLAPANAASLMNDSVHALMTKLQFMRATLGTPSQSDAFGDLNEGKTLLTDYIKLTKVNLVWTAAALDLTGRERAMVLNLSALSSMVLMTGGTLSVVLEAGPTGGFVLTCHAEGPRLRVRDDIEAVLTGEAPEVGWSAKNVVSYYTRMLMAETDARLSYRIEPQALHVSLNVPSRAET